MNLTKNQLKQLNKVVEGLYERLKARFLSRFFKGNAIYFHVANTSNPQNSIEGLFRYALAMLYGPNAKVDEHQIEKMAGIAGNYIDAERLRTLNQVIQTVEQAKDDKELDENLKDVFKKATSKVERIIVTESRNVSSLAERDGIIQLAATVGESDPTLARLGPLDAKTCKTCLKLWHDSVNPKIPKVYKASEIRDGYCDFKAPEPTWNSTHPSCRHVWTVVPKNYGFNESGHLSFKDFGWDEFAHRRNEIKKAENYTPILESCDCDDHFHDVED